MKCPITNYVGKGPMFVEAWKAGGNPDALGYVQLVESDLENLGALEIW